MDSTFFVEGVCCLQRFSVNYVALFPLIEARIHLHIRRNHPCSHRICWLLVGCQTKYCVTIIKDSREVLCFSNWIMKPASNISGRVKQLRNLKKISIIYTIVTSALPMGFPPWLSRILDWVSLYEPLHHYFCYIFFYFMSSSAGGNHLIVWWSSLVPVGP